MAITGNPYIDLAVFLFSTLMANNTRNQQVRAAEEADRRAQERYERAYADLESQLSGILDPNYSALSRDLIERILAAASQDVERGRLMAFDRALRDQARRGLAGHSLVDQRQAYIDERAQDALADMRARTELEAANMTAQQQAQARSILAGLTADNLRAQQAEARGLLESRDRAAQTYGNLAGTILGDLDWTSLWNPQDQASPAATASLSLPSDSAASIFDAPMLGAQVGPRVRWGKEA